ncbi:MAG: RNA polymerase sigma factor [Polyangiaceae bacterium]
MATPPTPIALTVPIARPERNSPEDILARAAAAGDAQATSKLVKLLAPRIVRSVRALMGASHPDADDVVQQALIAFVQALGAFRGDCSPAHYASRIVARTAIAARKRSRVRHARQDDSRDVDAFAEQEGPSSSDSILANRRKDLVRELLDQLPEAQAETVAMRFTLGLSLEEVAQATGVPLNTVRSRLRLAKEAIRGRIDQSPALLEELGI